MNATAAAMMEVSDIVTAIIPIITMIFNRNVRQLQGPLKHAIVTFPGTRDILSNRQKFLPNPYIDSWLCL